jgi:hypothetical protein
VACTCSSLRVLQEEEKVGAEAAAVVEAARMERIAKRKVEEEEEAMAKLNDGGKGSYMDYNAEVGADREGLSLGRGRDVGRGSEGRS